MRHADNEWNLNIVKYNVRSLLQEERLMDIEEELNGKNGNNFGFGEVWRRG